jgi:hypothetical protein
LNVKTSAILAKLKSMATEAGEAIFERTTLAEFLGDHDKARETLQADCFPELSLTFSLGRLLTLLATFPTVVEWRAHKFNLVRLWDEHEERRRAREGDKPKREVNRSKVADIEERDEKIKELEWAAKNTREIIEVKETELLRLRRENDELRGEVKALNRMLEQERQGRRQAV